MQRYYSGSLAAEGWRVWCGGLAATPHPPKLTHAERLKMRSLK